MSCPRCKARGKTWEGADPNCAFEDGEFSSDNWNCATMNKLRDLCGDEITVWNEDCNACILKTDECGYVLLSWYKQRGRTEGAWVFCGDSMGLLTMECAEMAISYQEDSNK